MPVPAAIVAMGNSAKLVGQHALTFANPNAGAAVGRAMLTRNFHAYLEVSMQGKHCQLMRGYCTKIGIRGRRQDGQQVGAIARTAEAALLVNGFYGGKGRIACEVAREHMIARWQQPQAPGTSAFTVGTRVDAAVQMQLQQDGYQYEVSYWYDSHDIYVLFHCYPGR